MSAGADRRRLAATLGRVPWWCWILLLVALEALAVLIFLPSTWTQAVGNGDGAEYQRYAFNLLHHGVFSEDPVAPYFPGVVRSPGYPAFLAAIEWIAGHSAVAVEATQFALLAVLAVLVGLLGREMAGPAVGTVAAVLCAVYLPFIGQATVFLTEVLACCLLAGFVLLLVRARRAESMGMYAASGVVLAAAIYVRPEYGLIAVPVVLILLLNRRSTWTLAKRTGVVAAFAAAVLIPLAPWIIRDASITGGKLVPMEATGGVTLLISVDQWDGYMAQSGLDVTKLDSQLVKILHTRAASVAHGGLDGAVEYRAARAQIAINTREQSAADKLLKSLSPVTVIKRLPARIVYLWSPADTNRPAKAGSAWHRLAQLQYALLIVLGAVGVFIRRRRLLADWPLWLVAVVETVSHLLFNVEARFTLPARPMLMIYASVGLVALASYLRRRRHAACA